MVGFVVAVVLIIFTCSENESEILFLIGKT